jgi:hypothetical protein
MAKTPSQKLFQIIHTLTPAEKRYFKLRYGKSQGEDAKYLKLFEVIEKMTTLNEAALQKAVYGTKKVEGKKFSELKNYCYQLILGILCDYDNEHSIDYRLKHNLLYVRSLYKRALYEDCQLLIDKTLKLAEEYEQFEAMLELLRWRKQIAYARGDIDFLNSDLNKIAVQENVLLAKVANILFYKNAFYQIHTTIRKFRLLENPELQQILKSLASSEMFSQLDKAQSFTAKVIYLRAASLMSYAMRDNERFYQYGKVLMDLMLSRPLLLREDVSEYISANSNFVMACMLTERSSATLEALENFKKVTPKTYDDRLKIHRQFYQGIFDFYHNTGDFDKGYEMLQLHLKEKQQFDHQAFNSQGFYYAYFYTSFGSKHFNEALDYLNEWLSDRNTVDRQDLQALARILSLIIHFEMGNTLLLESLMRSTARYLNKNTKMTAFEKELLRFIRKASTSANRMELKTIATDVLNSLSELSQDTTQGNFMQYFDFIAWIESKITNVDFAKIVQQRFAAKQINQ